MSEVDFESQVSSGDEAAGAERLVPVGEAIRYRKRAQNSESRVAELEGQLKASQARNEQLAGELNETKLERKLLSNLSGSFARLRRLRLKRKCSTYNSTPPLYVQPKPCIRTKLRAQKRLRHVNNSLGR